MEAYGRATAALIFLLRSCFGFGHGVTGERHDLTVARDAARVVEGVPGWAHNKVVRIMHGYTDYVKRVVWQEPS